MMTAMMPVAPTIVTTGDALTNCLDYIRDETGNAAAVQARESALRAIRQCVHHYNLKFGEGDVGVDGSGKVGTLFTPTKCESIPIGTNGLLYGKVQSGKTNATVATAALAGLNGFRCIVVLTSDNVWLGKQTYQRFRDALLEDGPVIRHWEDWRHDPASSGTQLKNALSDTGILLVSTKNVKNLENLCTVLRKAGAKNHPALIIDDEADNASLDTNTARRTRDSNVPPSEVFSHIADIRKLIPNHMYLQVTATPQSLLLQGLDHPSRPVFCEVSESGTGYIGGELFFTPSSPYACLVDASELNDLKSGKVNPGDSWSIPKGLRLALCTFFLGYAHKRIMIAKPSTVYSALIHICHRRINQEHVSQVIRSFVTDFDRALRGQLSATKQTQAVAWLKEAWDELKKTSSELMPLDALRTRLEKTLRNAIPEVINADNPTEEPEYRPGMNILVGGNRLGRGVTIKGLMVTYYGRDPKQKVMDTVHQHARMFGYRSQLRDVTRLFTAPHILDAFRQIYEADEATRTAIGDDPTNLRIKPVWVGTSLRPTRSNVLNPAEIGAISPGRAIFPADPKWKKSEVKKHTDQLDKLLDGFTGDEEYHEVDIDFLVEVLREMPSNPYPGYTWEDRRVQQVLEAMKREAIGIEKGRLNVRRGKDGKGLELTRKEELPWKGFASSQWVNTSKTDYSEQPTLIVMKQRGEGNGWDGQSVYLPTLVLPGGQYAFMFNYSDSGD
ncbi:Z1 domain-containing protein [Myxococcus sp. MxC21-1]|uniref:Z1 domain-containing protein n=1 Tax=Myxococcus sp. MxC21-1 TaxID=3041439 RepID=UPI002930E3FE|nr:Z1 domain-containing protein [Myxococcus sp. MxC21-1]WNZ62426.1 Z1 domain-containing protein [Myxococcus sp. MxC21-1]